jgi:hypothetical protein
VIPGRPPSPARHFTRCVLVSCWLGLATLPQLLHAAASCAGIGISSDAELAMGQLRSTPHGKGFIELHPIHGISIAGTGASHSGSYGVAVLTVSGPPGAEVLLDLLSSRLTDHDASGLSLSELLVWGAEGQQRIPARGGEIKITLSDRAGQDGRSLHRLKIGAVFKYRHVQGGAQSRYQLTARCLSLTF